MYIEPNTTIKLYSGIPLDNTYEHTLYFASLSAQNAYFHGGIAKYTLANNSYQRVERGRMRIEKKADDIYDCNYIAFQNTNYGNKWFYAFITGVEYINNVTSEITFELDDMQTYFFDVVLKPCYVEREHSATDEIGENLNPEPVELGELVSDDFDGTGEMGAKSIVVASAGIDQVFPYKGTVYTGVFSGVKYQDYPKTTQGVHDLVELLDNIGSQLTAERMVGIFMIPTCFVKPNAFDPIAQIPISKTKNLTTLGTYTPKNKKLFTFPYNYLGVNNLQGDESIYKYEFFDSNDCAFTLTGDYSINGQAFLIPMAYKGIPANYEEASSLNTTVQCSYNIASFIEGVGNAGLQIASAKGKNKAGETVWDKNAVVSGVLKGATSVLHSANFRGVTNSTILYAASILDFAFMHKHIQPQFAKRIDDFFDKYGYSTNEIKVPNRDVRPHWCYTKTNGCVVVGSAPIDSVRHICSIYDNGITFWKTASEVGDYTLDNSPT